MSVTVSSRAAAVQSKISKAPLLKASSFFTIKVVARAAAGDTEGGSFEGADDKFLLDDETWRKLQLYVKASQRLPTSEATLAAQYGDNMATALGESITNLMITTYSGIADHCDTFQRKYTDVVTLANDVVNYAKDTQTYYPAIEERFEIIINGKDSEAQDQAASQLRSIFAGLKDRTDSQAGKVKDVSDYIIEFRNITSKDGSQTTTLKERVVASDTEHGDTVTRIEKQISDKQKELDKANQEYEDALQKAKETAYYVWIPIFGWIAGPIVAGQANAEAKQAYEDMKRLSNDLAQLGIDLQNAKELKMAVERFTKQVGDIQDRIRDALDTLGIMSTAWKRMSDDFQEISEKLERWQEHTDIFAQLDFEAEKKKWAEIQLIADDYVARAFVEVSDDK